MLGPFAHPFSSWEKHPMHVRRLHASLTALLLAGSSLIAVRSFPAAEPAAERMAEVHVGIDGGDIRGNDHKALQAAVDYVAGLGGGTVFIGPGHYQMRNALTLRDNVRVVGVPGKSILAACDGFQTPLAADGDCNQRAITVADASGLHVGDGVAVVDERGSGGFEVTTATLTAREGANTFRLSQPLYLDYLVARKASVRLAFPVVGGWRVKNAAVEGLTVDGNRAKSLPLDGCRGGGIYLFECENVTISGCTVSNCNADGISFQVSRRIVVESCQTLNNAGHGLHPGSGSQQPVLRGNHSYGNAQDGLFVCWRVQHGLFANNIIEGNKRSGISIGHKDSDNLFEGNRIVANDSAGITFRAETEPMGAHRNRFAKNVILDNGIGKAKAAIVISGVHNDVVFQANVIGFSKADSAGKTGIRVSAVAKGLKADDNDFRNVGNRVEIDQKYGK
jgi:parallel beta-helix repeat protein